MKKNISIIGCGAIGSELALSVDRMMIENVTISSFLDIKLENAEILKSKLSNNNPIVFNNFSDYIKSDTFKDVNISSSSCFPKCSHKLSESNYFIEKRYISYECRCFC